MYDANNDDQISDLDLFKVFQKFGDPSVNSEKVFKASI
jgi:hypothetical protein